jgi:hypothetical protein
MIWKYKNLKVYYRSELDGGGRYLAQPMSEFIRQYLPFSDQCQKSFEWCCGPAFIGFTLIAENICKQICLVDINPKAIECVQKTVAENKLGHRINYYISDNLNAIPKKERFDLVIGNPPMYCDSGALCSHDPEWGTRRAFYANISNYLNKDAFLFISEVEPFKENIIIQGDPVTHRQCPRPPIEDFKEMIENSGLHYVETIPYMTLEKERVKMYLVISRRM